MEQMISAYIQAALWTSIDEEGEPLFEQYDHTDLAQETQTSMIEDCKDFLEALEEEEIPWEDYGTSDQLGHDFWLTRNRHGAGFWDGDWGDIGDKLTALAHPYGEVNLVVSDDGKIYI